MGKRAGEKGKVLKSHSELPALLLPPSPRMLSFRTVQPHVEVAAAHSVSNFQPRARCLRRPEGNTGGLFPREAAEVKAGTPEPLGTVKVQPQYISRMWEQFVCDTKRSGLVLDDLYP